ncbi:MAG: mandelate racemase, partial [Chloroflexi bacterium]|nr:mandelate racemase [Chloroflexota bacterium]
MGHAEVRFLSTTLVKLVTDTGLDGWGESTPFGSTYIAAHARGTRAGIAEIAPSLLGRDPRQVDRINDAMDEALAGHNHAKSAIDVACWDVFGKSVEMPV